MSQESRGASRRCVGIAISTANRHLVVSITFVAPNDLLGQGNHVMTSLF